MTATFPNAQIYLQRRNWNHARNPTEKDRASYLSENYALYVESAQLANKLSLLDTSPGKEDVIFPGITVEPLDGHTPGMQIVRINTSENKQVIYCADLIPTSTHIRLPFIMAYDCNPVLTLEEKKKFLLRAVEEHAILVFEHCPKMTTSTILKTDDGDFQADTAVSAL